MSATDFKSTYCLDKGVGDCASLFTEGWNILHEEVGLPAAVIYQDKITRNLEWMQSFADLSGVKLAPHGKTTMTPFFFKQQIKAGAWAITLASAQQVVTAFQQGINRIIMANQLVGMFNMQLISKALADPSFEFYCLVDSLDNVEQLGRYFQAQGQSLNVLIEIGVSGGRCGCRSEDDVNRLIESIKQFPGLKLVGIEFYEGVIHGEDEVNKIKEFLSGVVNMTHSLIKRDVFAQEEVLLTGAGSAWYDLVASALTQESVDKRICPIIRPGCYLIHDTGIYEQAQNSVLERGGLVCDVGGELVSSLEIWAYVLSIPEPGRAVIGMGKRDVAFDAGLPTPSLYYRPQTPKSSAADSRWQLTDIMDQHCFMSIPTDADLKVGDMVSFSTSHPCLTMDKWRKICIMDQQFIIRDVVDTYF